MDITTKRKGSFLKSFRTKILLVYVLTVAAIIVVLNFYPYNIGNEFIMETKKNKLQSETSSYVNTMGYTGDVTHENAAEVYSLLDIDSATRVIVTDYAGVAIFDSDKNANLEGKIIARSEIYLALSGKETFQNNFINNGIEFTSSVPIIIDGKIEGAIYTREFSVEEAKILLKSKNSLIYSSIFVFFGTIIISFFFTGFATKQIREILKVIQEMKSDGKLEKSVPIFTKDETGTLAMEFNQLIERLRINEERRRKFVSDASHEIKTPLSSIKLLGDSIIRSDEIEIDTVKEFLTDINGEIDRLTRITDDLLSLAKSDSEQEEELESVNISEVARRAIRRIAAYALDSGINVTSNITSEFYITAKEDALYQVIINLLENAVKYNKVDGQIMLHLYSTPERIILIIRDTGIGIPNEELPRIFDRFYRVDKARSRGTGGTGLGLSVVRTNIQRFRGKVTVESELGKGSKFIVEFPKIQTEDQDS